ncbi:MAG TPA: SDR family oxidoreductase [Anaerolineae bacterium]|nr:SDR family oxidoreductase [Anaerolineae bacterium]
MSRNTTLLGLGFLAGTLGGWLALPTLLEKEGTLPQLEDRPGTALITGASSGIGAAFARKLAAEGYDVVLVARRTERLAELARCLQEQYGIQAEPLTADLANPAEVERVEARLKSLDTLTLLVNNAGFGGFGPFVELERQRQLDMLSVNVTACVRLAYAALPGMISRRSGAIINVASVAAFLPSRLNVTYSATKSYLVAFSEALQADVRGTGLRVQALCPGLTRTEFADVAELDRINHRQVPAFIWMSAEQVVDRSLAGLKRGQTVVVTGPQNRLAIGLARTPGLRPLVLKLFNQRL